MIDTSLTAVGLFFLVFRPKVKKPEVKRYLIKFRPFIGVSLLAINLLLLYLIWNSKLGLEEAVSTYRSNSNSTLVTANIFIYGALSVLSLVYLLIKPSEQKIDDYLRIYNDKDLINLNKFKPYLLANVIFVVTVLNVILSFYNFMYPVLSSGFNY